MPDSGSREVLTRPSRPVDLSFSYGPHPDQVIDVRLPPRWPAPLVVMIHGGFWRAAFDRAHTGPMTSALADAGYVVAIPEFRRTGQEGGGWPGTFADVTSALAAVPDLLAPYARGLPVLLGHSAGGHLAVWAARSAPARSAVALAGCVDLAMCSRLGLDGGATEVLLGGTPESVPERYAYADPAALPSPPVPVVLLHGTADDRVPVAVSGSYASSRTGVTLRVLPGVGHFALIDPLSSAWPAVLAAVRESL